MRKLHASTFALVFATLAAFVALAACKADDGETRNGANSAATSAAETSARDATRSGPVVMNGNLVSAEDAKAGTAQDVRRVSIDELRAMLERDEAVAVDVRSKQSYDFGHISGALSIPREEVRERAGELPKDKLIVFYCA